ncbi:CDP-diacylglycerol/serine O-phosphatidyltransferase [Desulfotomaculum nigrificans CO-1-SRB]|uniref:CDP-diacylglycerol--serine O-phosphatidyltransferase n=1 Tax=Desulfotomaculum nigrificans (strain DSM 14880 / VKM B-2319 / CO-1-SRB) TaxID=868595 RepID=F6B4T4_DESCC|nr:CDP-diacylglycerol--serine O-phosphatidyltransferase [Desulfotomaculum nigrificans]AEF94196.1 CDP-diacylglycerol/serine O-phosphatidyltransferase [Desulfotomaculum nigrificans CO-1-SRB]
MSRGRHIPSLFTLGNLVFGVFALVLALGEQYNRGALMILMAGVMDFLDGKVARKLQVSSDFGKELDSLADLVSFGVAPAILAYALNLSDLGYMGLGISLAFVMCGALRLARFNVTTFSGSFMGVPITAAGAIVAILVLITNNQLPLPVLALPLVMLLLSGLMVSKLKVPKF